MATGQQLSHAEIWDDSSLINAWDSALQEYKKYHSIQATGGSVEGAVAAKNILAELEMKDVASVAHAQSSDNAVAEELEEGEVGPRNEEEQEDAQPAAGLPHTSPIDTLNQHPKHDEQASAAPTTGSVPHANMPQIPPGILAGQNEALRNLMISWYFAGYYTGLYEGQQQQQQQGQE
ncbi:hypothetical protein DFH27DRAFT_150464 [Peziza echinospora]|nr:hypothetical protein DFH27DRAFT_150464 [Peziza echinospora]